MKSNIVLLFRSFSVPVIGFALFLTGCGGGSNVSPNAGIGPTQPGFITEIPHVIPSGGQLMYIVKGPDGNLWFTNGLPQIGRITPSGVVTIFAHGISANAYPVNITAGPDGNLWFTEANVEGIGRITPTGVVTEFRAGISTQAGLNSIAAGPDGNIWFTEISGSV